MGQIREDIKEFILREFLPGENPHALTDSTPLITEGISHRIADMKVHLEAARLLTYRAAWRLNQTRRVSLDASIAKLFVSEALVKTALSTVQIFGGYGYLADNEVERTLRDSVASTIYSGTSEMQRNIIARWLGL